ncbi:MAG: alpha-galactosidase [Clostridia bacterium]|nr:alpha-galactosidase [Clostridia bacterium]
MNRSVSMAILHGNPALIDEKGRVLLTDIRAGIEYPGKTWNNLNIWSEGPWSLTGDDTCGTLRCENFAIEYRREGEGMALRTTYTHQGDELGMASRLYTLCGLWRCGFDRCLYNETRALSGVDFNEMQSPIHTVRFTDGQRVTGSENLALIDCEGGQVLAGYVTFNEYFTDLQAGSEGRLRAWAQLENRPLKSGDTITSDWLYIGLCDDVRWGLMDYAKIAARLMNSRAGLAETPYGFCTWYYYGNGLKAETVYENLETFRANRDRLDVKYFNLDDGWFKEWGDWTENEKFSCGMGKIADDIRDAGYLPGIWLAPFGAKIPSKLHTEHPDWFVRKYDSDELATFDCPWGQYISVDMSHPEVKKWVHDLYHKISHDWGYRHIKIDIITATLIPGRYYDPTFNTLKNYREGLRLIREAITDDTVLLTCTAPMGGAIGYADGMRTSEDIFEDWSCLLPIFAENLKRYYYNKLWFNNDPDCLLVRQAANEDEDCIRQCTRTVDEVRTFATALMATGGAMIMSDKMPRLEEYQLDLLSKMFPINTQAAVPLDLMDSEYPGILDLGRREKTHIYALINWTDAEKEMSVDAGSGLVFEFWAQEYLGKMQGVRKFRVEPHGVRLVFVTDDAEIAVIGADDCLCPEMVQEYKAGKLEGKFVKRGETLWMVCEREIEAAEGCTVEKVRDGLYRLHQTGESLNYRVKA